MPDNASPDPWDSLADSLGAKQSGDLQPRPSSPPPPPRRRERPVAKKPATPSGGGDWDSLAAEFGIGDRDQAGSRSERLERAGATRIDDESAERQDERPADSRRAADGEDGGDGGRRRRRRGRRGGRGRRREGERAEGAPPERERRPAGDRDEALREGERPRRGVARLPRPSDDVSEGESWREEIEADFVDAVPAEGERAAAPATGRPEGESPDGERPRRRRRGRRGGRGRGRESAAGDEAAPRRQAGPGTGDLDDEPLPASYGSRPADDAPPQPRAEAAGGNAGESEPSRSRGRRRRRSRREEGGVRRAGSGNRRESTATGRSSEGRDRRRRDESRSSRGRRGSDFAPVSGRYDEDDEGLEFLGVEEAAREPDARPRPAADDDVLAESGLTGVLDVPSWVEAIGIVIAGNLSARSRSGRGDGGKGR